MIRAILKVKDNKPQKEQKNSYQQCLNLDGVFDINPQLRLPTSSVLLLDDMSDSGWTFTVLAALLRQRGVEAVYPVALASTKVSEQ